MNDFVTEMLNLVGPWTIVFCLFIAIITTAFRRLVSMVWRNSESTWWWSEFVMHFLPLLLGAVVAAWVSGIPYPKGVDTMASRVIFGTVAGGVSGFVYFLVKKIVNKRLTDAGINAQLPDDDAITGQKKP